MALPLLLGFGLPALAGSGMLGAGAAATFLGGLSAPTLAGIGAGLGSFLETGDVGKGIQTGLIAGLGGKAMGALTGGGNAALSGAIGDTSSGAAKAAIDAAMKDGGKNAFLKGITSKGQDFGFTGDPSIETGRLGLRKFGDQGLEGKFSGAASATKDFFIEPKQTAVEIAGGQEAFDALKGPAQAELFKQASASGGLNLGKAIPAGLGIMAVTGAFDPIEEDPLDDPYDNTSRELVDMYPERYTSGRIVAPKRRTLQDILRESNPDYPPIEMYAKAGGEAFPRRMGAIAGPGTGTSDDVPAMLSDGEFVMTARAVRGAGNGSRKEGVKNMYDMMRAFEGGAVA